MISSCFSTTAMPNKTFARRPFLRSHRVCDFFIFSAHRRDHCSLQRRILSILTNCGKLGDQKSFQAAYAASTDFLPTVQLVFERFTREKKFGCQKIFHLLFDKSWKLHVFLYFFQKFSFHSQNYNILHQWLQVPFVTSVVLDASY